jgi:ribosome-binding protein aMBF1 (putative translation factor)
MVSTFPIATSPAFPAKVFAEQGNTKVEKRKDTESRNDTGRQIAYLRSQQDLSQETLVARLQCGGLDITRDVLANIETGRTEVPDIFLPHFQRALGVSIIRFFPKEVRDFEAKLANQIGDSPESTSNRAQD